MNVEVSPELYENLAVTFSNSKALEYFGNETLKKLYTLRCLSEVKGADNEFKVAHNIL